MNVLEQLIHTLLAFMTIIFLGELTVDSSDLADLLREDDEHYVTFATSANEVDEWAEHDRDHIVVLFDSQYATEAELLKSRFVTVERKSDMSDDEVLVAVEQAIQKLSPRIQQ